MPQKKGCIPWNKDKRGIYSKKTLEKMRNARLGTHPTEETRKLMSLSRSGKKSYWFGKHHTKKTNNKISKGNTGKVRTEEVLKKLSEISKERWKNPEHRRIILEKQLKRWQDPEFRARVIKATFEALKKKPTIPEQELDRLLQENFPNEFKYVGNGGIIIGGFCPDFINCNGKKLIIEMFGDFWHNNPKMKYTLREDVRREIFKKYGFDLLVIWEHELKEPEKVVEKIQNFLQEDENYG